MQVVKNKCAPPYKIAEFDIMFGSGISSLGCLLDAAEGVDVVQRKGSWYSFGDQKLGQGREKTMAILAESKDMQRYACLDLSSKAPCRLSLQASVAELALEKQARCVIAHACYATRQRSSLHALFRQC